jgi:hypothetical protein
MEINAYGKERTQRYSRFYYLPCYKLYSRVCVLWPELSQLIFGHSPLILQCQGKSFVKFVSMLIWLYTEWRMVHILYSIECSID